MSVTDVDPADISETGIRNTCEGCGRTVQVDERVVLWYWRGLLSRTCEECFDENDIHKLGRNAWYRQRKFRLRRKCGECGGELLIATAYHITNPHKLKSYCSNECRDALHKRRRRERNRLALEHRREARENTVCEVCGEPFTPNRSDARTCSVACKQKAYRERRAQQRESEEG